MLSHLPYIDFLLQFGSKNNYVYSLIWMYHKLSMCPNVWENLLFQVNTSSPSSGRICASVRLCRCFLYIIVIIVFHIFYFLFTIKINNFDCLYNSVWKSHSVQCWNWYTYSLLSRYVYYSAKSQNALLSHPHQMHK